MFKKYLLLALLFLAPLSLAAQESFFKVKRDKGYQWIIPDSLLGRDILFGSRIVDLSEPSAKVYAAGQMRTPPVVIRFERDGKLLKMYHIVNNYIVDKNDPIYNAVERNNIISPVGTFDIISREEGDGASVIDVTKYFSEEVAIAWPLPQNIKKGRLEPKLSSILFMKEYNDHVNVRCHYAFVGGKEPFGITVQYFMLLLPKEPLAFRFNDDRVGYQSMKIRSYASGRAIKGREIISRWRMEPKASDVAKHKAGKLVEPANPIVVYIEPYFPKEWMSYIKEGIEIWQTAFEKIGFKNAIIAREFPKDENFDPYDIKVNCVRYIPVDEANAAGQIWTDPRSGEIIQGEVLWWNNVVSLFSMWRFTQTAAVDPAARALQYKGEFMGEMIRYAIAHEIGHMLGLQHNMRSSFAYPVDSLRSPSFTKRYGTTASIMDYARNNHIAQPGDLERGVKMTPPLIGPFDIFSIEYGYKIFYKAKSSEDELKELNRLFLDKGNDPKFLFAPFIASPVSPDPSGQSESLGDDVIRSSSYGISNTSIILKNLLKWTKEAGGDEEVLMDRYDALIKQYYRYLTLALSYVGGEYVYYGPWEQHPQKYVAVPVTKQRESVKFVVEELMRAYENTVRPELYPFISSKSEDIYKRESDVVGMLLSNLLLPRIAEQESYSDSPYTIENYFEDIEDVMFDSSLPVNNHTSNIRESYYLYLKKLASWGDKSDEPISGAALRIKMAAGDQLKKSKYNNN